MRLPGTLATILAAFGACALAPHGAWAAAPMCGIASRAPARYNHVVWFIFREPRAAPDHRAAAQGAVLQPPTAALRRRDALCRDRPPVPSELHRADLRRYAGDRRRRFPEGAHGRGPLGLRRCRLLALVRRVDAARVHAPRRLPRVDLTEAARRVEVAIELGTSSISYPGT